MKRLAIFDFDGTLFDSVDDVINCFNKALTTHDFPILTREEYIKCFGGDIDEIVSLVLKDKSSGENIELVKETYLNCYKSSKKENTLPFPEIHQLLKILQDNNVLLAINSNRLNYSVKFFTEKYLNDINFSYIAGQDPDIPSKPDPYCVNKIIKKMQLSNDEVIYIGDSRTDIKTAQNADIDCLIVKWGYGDENDYKNPNILNCVQNPLEILDYFDISY